MDNNIELKGIELLYYLMSHFNMTYNNAIKSMEDNNQDVESIKTLVNKNILNNSKIGSK